MKKLGCMLTAFLFLLAGLLAADVPESIKDVMANHKKGKLRDQIGADLKKDVPDWPAVQKKTGEYLEQASALEKFSPPKGEPAAFKKTAGAFAMTVKALNEAAEKKDKKAATAAFQKTGAACMGCHKAHRN